MYDFIYDTVEITILSMLNSNIVYNYKSVTVLVTFCCYDQTLIKTTLERKRIYLGYTYISQ